MLLRRIWIESEHRLRDLLIYHMSADTVVIRFALVLVWDVAEQNQSGQIICRMGEGTKFISCAYVLIRLYLNMANQYYPLVTSVQTPLTLHELVSWSNSM